MSSESPKFCKDCELGKIMVGHHVQFNTSEFGGRIPIGLSIPPKIERNCINFIERLIKKREKTVYLYGVCDKPELYTPKIVDQEAE